MLVGEDFFLCVCVYGCACVLCLSAILRMAFSSRQNVVLNDSRRISQGEGEIGEMRDVGSFWGRIPLRHIHVALLPDLPDTDLHPVLGDHDVLLLHLLARFVGDVVADGVDHVADEGEDAEDREEDEERGEGVHRCGFDEEVFVVGWKRKGGDVGA